MSTEVPIEAASTQHVSEEQEIIRQKCKDLKKKILTVEESNKVAALAILRTRNSINRLRLEYSILLERLESKIGIPNHNEDSSESEVEFTDKKPTKKKKNINTPTIRDPDQPKRPLNPYLIFCELEKENLKKQAEEEGRTIDLSKTLSETWKNLSDEDKHTYIDIYNEDKERYQREMDLYGKVNPKRQKLVTTNDIKLDEDGTQSPEP